MIKQIEEILRKELEAVERFDPYENKAVPSVSGIPAAASAIAELFAGVEANKVNKCKACNGTGETLNYDRVLVGAQMRQRRLNLGVGLRQFAKTLNLKPSHLCELEKGLRNWNGARFAQINEQLGILEAKNEQQS